MVSVNLIPQRVVASQARRWRIKRWCVSTLIAVCALLVALLVDGLQHAKAGALQSDLAAIRLDLGKVRQDLAEVVDKSAKVWHQVERANAIRAKRSWSSLVALIDRALPKRCWLATLATDPPSPTGRRSAARRRVSTAAKAAAKGATDEPIIIEAPRRIKIEGYAPSDALPHTFITALKATGVFSNVVLIRSRRQPLLDSYYFYFEVLCEW